MRSFGQFLEALGGLHDAHVKRFQYEAAAALLTVEIDDLYSNFAGLPEYRGLTPAIFFLEEFEVISGGLPSKPETLWICEVEITREIDLGLYATIRWQPSGKLECAFRMPRISSGAIQFWPENQ